MKRRDFMVGSLFTTVLAACNPKTEIEFEKPIFIGSLKAAAKKMAQPAIGFQPLYKGLYQTQDTGCWTGGLPELPVDFDWPLATVETTKTIVLMTFLAQIDCEKLPAESSELFSLPKDGTLSFFACLENYPQTCRVVYTPKGKPTQLLNPPEIAFSNFTLNYDYPDRHGLLPKTYLWPTLFNSTPSIEFVFGPNGKYEDQNWDDFEIHENAELLESYHRNAFVRSLQKQGIADSAKNKYDNVVPVGCQDVPAYNDEYITLLTLQFDDRSGITFGDTGDIYFRMKRDDLARLDFSDVYVRADSS